MTIKWYPGHMSKARKKMSELIRNFDVIIEVLDARLPVASSNHLLTELRRNKPCIKVLNKSDLADPVVTRQWVRHFEEQSGVKALPMSAKQHSDMKKLMQLCLRMAPTRGKPGKALRAMVIGIPNVGKSTIINALAGKSVAKVADKPAITTATQMIDLHNGIILSDTPGLLWPELTDQDGAHRLAASGAIGIGAFDFTSVGVFAIEYLRLRYPKLLAARYKLDELPEDPVAIIEGIGRRLGCLVPGGGIDLHRSADAFLRELRGGKIGRISLEAPGDQVSEEPAPDGETVKEEPTN